MDTTCTTRPLCDSQFHNHAQDNALIGYSDVYSYNFTEVSLMPLGLTRPRRKHDTRRSQTLMPRYAASMMNADTRKKEIHPCHASLDAILHGLPDHSKDTSTTNAEPTKTRSPINRTPSDSHNNPFLQGISHVVSRRRNRLLAIILVSALRKRPGQAGQMADDLGVGAAVPAILGGQDPSADLLNLVSHGVE